MSGHGVGISTGKEREECKKKYLRISCKKNFQT
jgi:hypothetical protein